MSKIPHLSEAEIEDRFHITSRTAVHFTLAAFVKARESFSVQFNANRELFVTILLAVQADKDRLIFDCSGSTETNQHFLNSEKNVFLGRPGGIPVQFSTGPAVEIIHEGGKAFAVGLPDALIRLQRREHFRIEMPRANALTFFGRLPGGALLKLPANDISVSGIGLNCETVPAGLEIEHVLEKCHFMLPGESREFFFSATVRRIVEIPRPTGKSHWRLGLEFNNLTSGDETRLQRYIARIERERRDLS